MSLDIKKVLFFDSGVGGLSIYKDVVEKNTNLKSFYLFDNEFFPYGNKDEHLLKDRVLSLVKRSIERFDIDLVVIACNTASTTVLPTLRAKLSIPVVGVVPAIKPAAKMSKKKIIGLLATPGTVSREYTKELINKFAKDCKVKLIGSTDLVLIAENKIRGSFVDKSKIKAITDGFFDDETTVPDVIVMGCTHFPFLKQEILESIDSKYDVELIDSGEAIGNRVHSLLDDEQMYLIKEMENKNILDKYKEKNTKSYAFYTGYLDNYEKEREAFLEFGFESLEKFG